MATIERNDHLIQAITLRRREALALLAGSALAGASSGVLAQKQGGVLKIAAPTNPQTLDPATGGSGADHVFLWTMFDTLIDWDPVTLKPRPGMAEWSTPDANSFVLTIRPGIVFHDGTPMDAAAVKFNLDRGRTDARSNLKADLANITNVEVTGPLTVKLTLAQPDAALPGILSDRSGMMASPKAIQALGQGHDRAPVGAGRWKFVSWADNQKVVVTRNENYWQKGQPYLDGIEMTIITEQATAIRSVVARESHLAYALSPRYTPILNRAKDVQLVKGPTLFVQMIYFNYSKGPLANQKLRQAINFAIDRQVYVNATMAGQGEPAYMLLPQAHWGYDKSVAQMYPYDPARARKLMDEAGFGSGVDISFGGYNDQDSVQRSEIIIDMLGKVGVRCKFTNGLLPDISRAFQGPEKRFEAMVSSWSGRPDPSMTYGSMFSKDSYYNAGRSEGSPELTQAMADSRSKEDIAYRTEQFAKVQRMVMDLALCAPLAFNPELDAASKDVRGLKANLLGKPKFWDASLG